jgi:hypothetical protein
MMAGDHFPRENALPLRKKAQKVPVFQEKDRFWAISGCRSENALLGDFNLMHHATHHHSCPYRLSVAKNASTARLPYKPKQEPRQLC